MTGIELDVHIKRLRVPVMILLLKYFNRPCQASYHVKVTPEHCKLIIFHLIVVICYSVIVLLTKFP